MDLLTTLQASPTLLISVVTLLGMLVGSFLNVAIHRMPIMLERAWQAECAYARGEEPAPQNKYNLVVPRSACPQCGHKISAGENIPVVSYLLLGGKYKQCKTPISARYPLVEALTGVLSGYIAFHFGYGPQLIGALFFCWILVALTFIDFDTQLLPDDLTLPLLWLGLAFNISGSFVSLSHAVIGAMAGYLILWSVYWLFKLIRGKEGMGYGDFKLLAAIGAWLGWQALPLVILLSSVVGVIAGIIINIRAKHGLSSPFAFGPYLAIAGMIAMLWGPVLTAMYLGQAQ
ncbi:MAG: prepilin peptidase [Neisseriaceae bacterium]|nr:MAG: prepilin peptidase [Neisseriaceae bacterium]